VVEVTVKILRKAPVTRTLLASFDTVPMAGACVAALPMIAIFLLLQRHFLKGLTLGAVKALLQAAGPISKVGE